MKFKLKGLFLGPILCLMGRLYVPFAISFRLFVLGFHRSLKGYSLCIIDNPFPRQRLFPFFRSPLIRKRNYILIIPLEPLNNACVPYKHLQRV